PVYATPTHQSQSVDPGSGATALFSDPEFDGPPERVDQEEIDDEGNVVVDAVVMEPEPPFDQGERDPRGDVGLDPEDLDHMPRAKFYVGDVEVWVTAEAALPSRPRQPPASACRVPRLCD
ncbi:MAG: hypothetical protein ACOYBY_19040, partial [Dermatophilaceae bacterium]